MEEKNNDCTKTKNIKKVIKIVLAIFLIVVAYVICVHIGIQQKLKQIGKMGYTEYNLTPVDIARLEIYFDVYIPEVLTYDFLDVAYFGIGTKYDLDKDKYELHIGGKTQRAIDEFNKLIFEEHVLDGTIEMAKGYGITEDNPATVEWVMKHPREALDLVCSSNYYCMALEYRIYKGLDF